MSILILPLSPRPRLRARGEGETAPGATRSAEVDYILTNDDLVVMAEGRAKPGLLPRATQVVGVLGDADVAWHRITLPKASGPKLRAALAGVLEEALLDEDAHLAVAPGAQGGKPAWIAAIDRAWLTGQLAALERGKVFVDRLVPSSWPDDPPSGHFAEEPAVAGSAPGATLTWADADGVATLRLSGTLVRSMLPDPLPVHARWTATPATAAAASAWLGLPVTSMTATQRMLQAVRTTWNLRQFDLAARHRGARAVRDALRHFLSPAWRPVRYGLVALAVVQIVGLNLWAWQQRAAIDQRRADMVALLRATYPNITAVLDAPVQMQRETDSLRAAAGRSGDADIETMMQAAASAWPSNLPPVEGLRYEPGRLSLSAAGWTPDDIEQFRAQLRPSGWQVETADGRVTLSRTGGAS